MSDWLLDSLLNIALHYKDRIDASLFLPRVNWRLASNDRQSPAVTTFAK